MMDYEIKYEMMKEEDIVATLNEVISKDGDLLNYIRIEIWEHEDAIRLMCSPCFKENIIRPLSLQSKSFCVCKYPKYFNGIYVEDISIEKAKEHGRNLYYKYRKKYPLKRNLSKIE